MHQCESNLPTCSLSCRLRTYEQTVPLAQWHQARLVRSLLPIVALE